MNAVLLEILEKTRVPRTIEELSTMMNEDITAVRAALIELMENGYAACTKKGKYAIPEKLDLIACRVTMNHSGAPMAHPIKGGTALKLKETKLHAMPDDIVLAHAAEDGVCELISVCRRGHTTIPVYIRSEEAKRGKKGARGAAKNDEPPRFAATACDPRVSCKIQLTGDTSFLRNNEIALLEIEDYPYDKRPLFGHAIRVLGSAQSMLSALRANAETHGFPTVFPEKVDREIVRIVREPMPAASERRMDLRDEVIFTIDGANSKDFDDAISVRQLAHGWELGVHIADVSHFVRLGTETDKEAYARGTSLYLPGCTVPMLPEELSNDLCSLMPDRDRLAMSLMMTVSSDGHVTDHKLTRSIIRSCARLTYAGVNRFFDGAEEDIPEDVADSLWIMKELAETLQKRAAERGTVDFEIEESEFVLNEKYEPIDLIPRERGISERLIESFMLLANETVARLAKDTGLPFMYRIHEKPDPDRIAELESYLKVNGTPVHLGNEPHPGQLRKLLEAHADDPALDVLRTTMLRAMKKARYCERPEGHYALAMEDYSHFTSPIRRYPDLVVHRMLKCLLDGTPTRRWESLMPDMANACSTREQESVRSEREADSMMKAAYMKRNIGRKFNGVISGVTGWGAYVELPGGIEGLVHVADMDEYYVYNADKGRLVSSESGSELKMGMPVRVRVISADVSRGEINFEFARNRF